MKLSVIREMSTGDVACFSAPLGEGKYGTASRRPPTKVWQPEKVGGKISKSTSWMFPANIRKRNKPLYDVIGT
jgi:hypothetical protein